MIVEGTTSSTSVVPMRVLIVEDNALMRAAISRRLRDERDIEITGEAEGHFEALRSIAERVPDVVVLDLRLGRSTQDGLELASEIGRRFPDVRIVIYSAYPVEERKPGARNVYGRVVKTDPPRSVVEAVRTVATGGSYRSPGWRSGEELPGG